MLIQEVFVNRSEDCIFGESDSYETWTDNVGELFRSLQREYGRCTGKQYTEFKDGTDKQTGWVFVQRRKYQDCNDTYLQETWVTVYARYKEKTVIDCEYHEF